MKKLLLCVLLLLPLPSCSASYPVANPREPCHVPGPPPAPQVTAHICELDTMVCLTSEGAVALARYLRAVKERELALAACVQVVSP